MEFQKLSTCKNFSEISNIFIPHHKILNQIDTKLNTEGLDSQKFTWLTSLAVSFLLQSKVLDHICLQETGVKSVSCIADNSKKLIFLQVPDKSFVNSVYDLEKFQQKFGSITQKLIEYKSVESK